ncbi:GTP-binding protein [Deinococcus hohokamensis]|uniref:GTP-binding protein n=1 Tax=Deinococcus hohokamensis TaxID=309883 RepID=A0ABV9IE87_9DEIO
MPHLIGRVHVDTMITVVDTAQFVTLWYCQDALPVDDQDRGFGELLAESLEFADIVELNELDLCSSDDVAHLRPPADHHPRARVLDAVRGQIPAAEVLGVSLFVFKTASQLDAWMEELKKEHTRI